METQETRPTSGPSPHHDAVDEIAAIIRAHPSPELWMRAWVYLMERIKRDCGVYEASIGEIAISLKVSRKQARAALDYLRDNKFVGWSWVRGETGAWTLPKFDGEGRS